MAAAPMPVWSSKFNLTGSVLLGSLMLTEEEVDEVQGCFTLRQVDAVTPQGVSQGEHMGGAEMRRSASD